MKRRLLLLALLAGFAAAAWLFVLSPRLNPAPVPDDPDLRAMFGTGTETPTPRQREALRREAGNACRCARRAPDAARGEACWAGFNRQLVRFEYSLGGTLCGPMSTEEVCFGGDCVVKSYGGGACSADEARILQAIVDAEFGRSPERFQRRMNEAVHSFIRGERVEAPRSRGSCAG